ncbi:F0F1 ATP synthase subunit delta [Thiotrichales bacterium 19S9-12]|nr:F0F1 ATP synthase subunit delta [Thiotrichales bacterium 19S9-11]MCF6811519.1 F0F1 ATP synthase subunit delta [Thiotrichales bacterium 19S9-12]
MAELYHLARPYAKAAFEYADEKGLLSQWLALFQMAEKAILSDQVCAYLNHPVISQKEIVAVMVEALKIQDKAFINLLDVISHYKRLAVLGAICELFNQLKAEKERSVHAVLTSAFEVSPKLISAMKAKLEKKFNANVLLEVETDSSLIGGAVIQVGDMVIDGSVLGNFRRLKQELMA